MRVAVSTGRRQFVHVWTAPRSPAARVVVAPVLLLATLLILAAGLVALLAFVTVALVIAFFALLIRAPVAAIRGRRDLRDRKRPGS